jgi:hypothetical protein
MLIPLARHPHSVDSLCTLPSSYFSSDSTILTGSSDGLLRVVQLFPTKLLGIISDHGEFPIERVAIDHRGEGKWVGSVGHEEVLRMTDLQSILEDDGDVREGIGEGEESSHGAKAFGNENEESGVDPRNGDLEAQDSGGDAPKRGKKKRKDKELLSKKRSGRDELDTTPSFFDEL